MIIQTLLNYHEWSLMALRLVVAVIFLAHGWPKIKNLKHTAVMFTQMGFKPGALWGTIVAAIEFFGGVGLLLGFYTQVYAAVLVVQMLVATLWKIRIGKKLVDGYELDLLLVAATLVLVTGGPGMYALDTWLGPLY